MMTKRTSGFGGSEARAKLMPNEYARSRNTALKAKQATILTCSSDTAFGVTKVWLDEFEAVAKLF